MVEDGWWTGGTLRLHYLKAGATGHGTPLAYVPGALGEAEDFRPEMERLSPRPTIAVSPRGLGRSAAPKRGYGLEDRTRDLEAVLTQHAGPPACVMAFSLGVPVAVRYASRNPQAVAGLILLDYPARYPKFSKAWVEGALREARRRGIPGHVVLRMREESSSTELWGELTEITVPVLIIKGGESSAISTQDLARYQVSLPHARIEVFENAGHEVFRPDYERFMRRVEAFLHGLDSRG